MPKPEETWSIRYAGEEAYPLVSSTREEAEDVARHYRETGEHPDAVAYDRMAELLARFPIGSKVRHTTSGRIVEVLGEHRIYDLYPESSSRPDRRYAASVRTTHFGGMSAGFIEPVTES